MAALQAQVLDIRAGYLGHAQAVQGEQRDQRMLTRRAEPGSDQQRAELVAVQRGGVGLIVQPRTADMGGRRMIQELFFDGVLVEPRDGGQPAGDGGASASPGFQLAGEASMSARRTANRASERVRHQLVNWRRSRG